MASQNIIPFFGIKRQYANLREELLHASDEVYRSGQVLDGPYTETFEKRIAQRCNRRYAVAVNSCTQALIFAQQLLFKEPTKILIPTISFVATINSVLLNGNTPLLCDTDDRALIDLESIDYALNAGGVGGIMYVNLFGNIVDWDRFSLQTKFFGQELPVIEDAAQSFGASYKGKPSGSLGDISVLSFDPTKNLPNYGSGGMLLVDTLFDAKILRDLRDNGKTNDHDYPGTNSKMSEADCAQLTVKLGHFDEWQQRRRDIAEYYNQELADCKLIDIPTHSNDVVHAWHKYVIRTSDRSKLKHHLTMCGIETKIHYEKPLFEYPVGYPYINYVSELYRNASAFCTECLSLPIYPEMTDEEVEHVVDSVKEFTG